MGAVSRWALCVCSSLDQAGPMTQTVRDANHLGLWPVDAKDSTSAGGRARFRSGADGEFGAKKIGNPARISALIGIPRNR